MPIHFVKKKQIERGKRRSVLQNGGPDPIWVIPRGIVLILSTMGFKSHAKGKNM